VKSFLDFTGFEGGRIALTGWITKCFLADMIGEFSSFAG
jgi:hypothetical protein